MMPLFAKQKKRILSESEREQQKLAAKADADFGFFECSVV